MIEYCGKTYNERHGGPFDRGTADSWYSRPKDPHYFVGATAVTAKVEIKDMTESEVVEYLAGYEWNEDFGGKKEW